MPKASKDLACTIFKQLLEPVESNIPEIPSGKQAGRVDDSSPTAPSSAIDDVDVASDTQLRYTSDDDPSLAGLMGGGS